MTSAIQIALIAWMLPIAWVIGAAAFASIDRFFGSDTIHTSPKGRSSLKLPVGYPIPTGLFVPAHWWLLSYDPMMVSDRERQTRCDLDLIGRLSDRAEQLMAERDAR